MAKTSPAKLFLFFIFFACVRKLENLATISGIVDVQIPRNSLGTDAYPCQKVGRVEGKCDESDMASFTNAVTCTRAFLLDHKPYHAADFVSEFHRQNAGRIGFFVEALLHKLDLPPSFINKCTRTSERETVLVDYHRGLNVMLEELDKSGIFEEMSFSVGEEDELDDDKDNDDYDDNNEDDLFNDDGLEGDIEDNFID